MCMRVCLCIFAYERVCLCKQGAYGGGGDGWSPVICVAMEIREARQPGRENDSFCINHADI